ncbi:odorant receptor 30a-like isoform X1 [Cylas formicarius]|uniref:odorant receptor 30a-like isoform X1 n=1 Tax=Cylas formicarius TaxID=197179 RepID=UPI002958C6C0|nr:odorant receptor 30a-like isoform X1 [Cylas formicarius]
MTVIGIWKVENPRHSVFRKRVYQVYSVSFQMFCYSVALSLLAEIPALAKSDVMSAMDNANRFTVYIVIIIKMIAWQSKRMVDLLGVMLQRNSQIQAASRVDLAIRRLYRNHVRYNLKFVFVLVSSGVVISLSISMAGFVGVYRFIHSPENGNGSEKPLPLKFWYPFDSKQHYLLALADQNIRPTLSCFCLGVTSASLNSLAIFVRVQLKVLQHHFKHFRGGLEAAIDSLRPLCIEHQRLIAYTIEFSESLRYIVMLDYTVCSVTFALLIFQIATGEELLMNFALLTFTIFQLMTFSWNCNEIIVQSTGLADSLFESDWYNQGQHAKVLIRIMMMRCQKPLSLRIGWLGVMDLDAGLSVSEAEIGLFLHLYYEELMSVSKLFVRNLMERKNQ